MSGDVIAGKRKVAFCLDANEHVASGHMIRCISIAAECKKLGIDCCFFVSKDSITDPLESAGFRYVYTQRHWDEWDRKIESFIAQLIDEQVDYLVVDSYLVNERFFETVSKQVRVLYLDDQCLRPYSVDAVLHYSEWPDEHILADLYKDSPARVYSGMQFIPLRAEFRGKQTSIASPYDLLITTGGSDKYHVTRQLLDIIAGTEELEDLRVCAVFGMLNPDFDEAKHLYGERFSILHNVSNMAELMRGSNCAVAAGGMTVYELMVSGTYPIVFSFSDQQTYFGERLMDHGNCVFAGDVRKSRETVFDNLLKAINGFCNGNREEQEAAISRNRELVDGQGCTRIAKLLSELSA